MWGGKAVRLGDGGAWLRLIVAISSRHARQNNQRWDKGCRKLCSTHQHALSFMHTHQVMHTHTHTYTTLQVETHTLVHTHTCKPPTPLYHQSAAPAVFSHYKLLRTESDDVTGSSAHSSHHLPPGVLDQSNLGHAHRHTHTHTHTHSDGWSVVRDTGGSVLPFDR